MSQNRVEEEFEVEVKHSLEFAKLGEALESIADSESEYYPERKFSGKIKQKTPTHHRTKSHYSNAVNMNPPTLSVRQFPTGKYK